MSNLLFSQRPGTEREFYEKLTVEEKRSVNRAVPSRMWLEFVWRNLRYDEVI
jgi:hypothetical protein